MTLSYTYDGGALAHNIAPTGIALPTRADMGEASFGGTPIEDPGASLTTLGHRPFLVEDDECAQPRLWTGYVTERGIGRSLERGMFVGPNARLHDMTIVDCNAVFDFRMIKGTDGNRPEETWDERLAWILASNYLDGTSGTLVTGTLKTAGGWLMSSSVTMDKADYRGSYPSSVMGDLAARFEGQLNWFAFWNPVASQVELFFDAKGNGIANCTLSISNLIADVDSIVTFAPDSAASLAREPDQVYSEVVVEYSGGRKVFRTRPSTALRYVRRGTTISRPYIGKEATAQLAAEGFLDAHDTELDRITCSIQVPAASVGLIQAGMLIECKFTHMPGYEAFTWLRIVGCSPKPTNDVGDFYDVALELVGAKPPPEPETTQIALLFSDTGCGTQDYPRVVRFTHLGDSPPSGWDPLTTLGPVEVTACDNYLGDPGYAGVRVLGSGTVSVEHYGGVGGVSEYGDTITWAIRQNGTVIVSDSWTDPVAGWGHASFFDTYLLIEDVAVVAGDIFDTYVTITGGVTWQGVYYRKVGVPWNPSLKVWGDVAPGGSGADVEDDPLPPPPTGTTSHQTDPTVNDDGEAGYHVGAVWVNEATGEVFVLVDETDGAAVWISVTAGSTFSGAAIEWVVDGAGAELTTGLKGFLEIPFACTITAARLLADQTGDAVVDVWAEGYADYPPTNADSITAAAPLTIASGVKSEDVTLTGWTTTIAAGDILGFNVDSVADVTRLTISLTVTRT